MNKRIKTIGLTAIIALSLGSLSYADEITEETILEETIVKEESDKIFTPEYNINLTPREKIAKANEIVNIVYTFSEKNNIITNTDFVICIDIPVQLELQNFKINGIETDSKIAPLNSKFNRIYLPVKYTQEIVVDYDVKVLDTLPEGVRTWISHGMRDAATGQHVNVDWTKSYITRFDGVGDGTDNDNNTVEPPVLDGSEDDNMLVDPPVGDGTDEDNMEVEPPVGDGSNEDDMLVEPLPEPVIPLPDKEEGGPTAEPDVQPPVLDGTDNDNIMVDPPKEEVVEDSKEDNTNNNPKTGDAGFVMYGVLGTISGIGILLNKRK